MKNVDQIASLLMQKQASQREQSPVLREVANAVLQRLSQPANVPADPNAPQLGTGIVPYSVVGGESGRMGAPITMRGGTDDPAGAAMAMGQSLSAPEMAPSPGQVPDPLTMVGPYYADAPNEMIYGVQPPRPDMLNGGQIGGYEGLGQDTGVTPRVGDSPMEYRPEMMPSPGMQPGPMAFPQAPDTFGGYDDGLRPTPHTADVPVTGNTQTLTQMARDAQALGRYDLDDRIEGIMDRYPNGMPPYQMLPPDVGQEYDAIADALGQSGRGFTPAPSQDSRKGPVAPGRINKQVSEQELAPERLEEEGPPPSMDEIAQMAQSVGIPQDALQGLDLNATEARNAGYLLRMMEAENTIRELQDSNTLGQRLLELLPGQDIEAMFMDPDYRRYMLARENFNEAALRSATGATINQSEMPTQRRNYFPLPSDDKETREFLQRQRQALLMALQASSGGVGALVPSFGEPVVPRDAGPVDYSTMSDEELLRALQGGN